MTAITLNDIRAQLWGTPPNRASFEHALPLVDAIEARAAEDPEYAAIFVQTWLDGLVQNTTVWLRDEICAPLRHLPEIVEIGKQFNPTTEWHNTWMPLDTAAHRARHGLYPEEW